MGLSGKHRQALLSVVKMRETLEKEPRGDQPTLDFNHTIDTKGTVIFRIPGVGTIRDTGKEVCYRPVGTIKGVGRIYQQTYVDTYSKWAAAKLYTTKTPITSADLLNDKVLPFMTSLDMGVIRILTDRGTEYCGKLETHDYQLYLAINDIEHTKTKVRHPQTNGICERFHKTILDEFYRVTFRKKIYQTLDELKRSTVSINLTIAPPSNGDFV